ncbi:tyrosine protein kinase [Pigmentiphaga sp. NML030171]|nr:tyrosine protein kinase [Pigmentiphaga sp. NML030171]
MNQTSVVANELQSDHAILAHYLDIILENKWVISIVTALFLAAGIAYAYLTKPIYQSDLLIQVEDGQVGVRGLLGETADALTGKTAASAELEILRSRLVVAEAVDNLKLTILARPKYFPIFGEWWASKKTDLSTPGIFGYGGYVWGSEQIAVDELEVPVALQGKIIELTAAGAGEYSLVSEGFNGEVKGRVGQRETLETNVGPITIIVSRLDAKAGAKFEIASFSRLLTIRELQASLDISEKGKQSGVIGATLEGTDPVRTAQILSEIGKQYITQNVERRSAEAEKSLEFLDKQLPTLKKEVEQAEERYNQLRNQRGTINLGEEASLLLQRSVETKTTLFNLEQNKKELLTRFTQEHPSIRAIDTQIAALNKQLDQLTGSIKQLPNLEQDVLRLTRDVKVSTDLYASLLNETQRLRLVKAGRIGNVRLVDDAVVPEVPVRPKRLLAILFSLFLGVFAGTVIAFIRHALFGGVTDPHDIESKAGLNVYATIPFSDRQREISGHLKGKNKYGGVLAQFYPSEPAIEALRSLRTAMQFTLADTSNQVILITGPAPGVGKSFLSSNFAAVLANSGKKVLLIDADMRKGYLHQYFSISRDNGLSELLAGNITAQDAIRKDVMSGVDFIPTGALPPNPGELLLSPALSRALEFLKQEYDIVVIDTPPVLVAADTSALATKVDAIFLVARSERTTIGELQESTKRLQQAGSAVAGVIFNGLRASVGKYGYGGRYARYRYVAYAYEADEDKR